MTTTRHAILVGYNGMWSDWQKDELTSNWQNPVLVNHATGKALLLLDESMAVDSHDGLIGKGSPVLNPQVTSMTPATDPTSAGVTDCADLSHFLKYVAATGTLQNNTPGGRHLVAAGLVKQNGIWKVSTLTMGRVGSC